MIWIRGSVDSNKRNNGSNSRSERHSTSSKQEHLGGTGLSRRWPYTAAFRLLTLLLHSGQTQQETLGLDWVSGPQRQYSNQLTHKQTQQRGGGSANQSSSESPARVEGKRLQFDKTLVEVPGEEASKFFHSVFTFLLKHCSQ